jgi:hypothetical protein
MCGRFTQNYTWQQVHEFLSVFGAPRKVASAIQRCRNRAIAILTILACATGPAWAQQSISINGHAISLHCSQWKKNADGSWTTVGTEKDENMTMNNVTLRSQIETRALDRACSPQ